MPEKLTNLTGNFFALEVKGDSMRDMLISEGDIVILRQTQQAQNGQIVAAWIKSSGETTLKSYYLENGHVRLQPANPEYEPIIANPDDVEIQGQVVSLYRQYLL
jgi:repressor LexA